MSFSSTLLTRNRVQSRAWRFPVQALFLSTLGGLFLYNSLQHTRQFPYDAMNYVDVARHVAAGEGLVQTTVGMFQPRLSELPLEGPVPFVAQGPLYPLLCAGLHRLGLGLEDAALLLSALGYAVTLLLCHALARSLFGKAASTLALAGALVYAPLAQAGRTALTEALAAALLLGCLLTLAHSTRRTTPWGLLGAGLLAGLCFALRYALVWLIPLGLLWTLWRGGKSRRAKTLLFSMGASLVVVPTLLHNRLALGTFFTVPLPSDRGWLENLKDTVLGLLGNVLFTERHQVPQALLMGVLLLTLLCLRGRYTRRHSLRSATGSLLLLWALTYTSALLVQRAQVHFDPLDSRLLLPTSLALLLLGAGLVTRSLPPQQARRLAQGAFVLACLLAFGRELRLMRLTPTPPGASPRLRWLQEHTDSQAYLVGDDAMDLPFFLQRRRVLSLSAYPYNERVDIAFLQARARQGSPLYLVLRRPQGESAETLAYQYGPLFAALKQGRIDKGVPLVRAAVLEDAFIYRVVM